MERIDALLAEHRDVERAYLTNHAVNAPQLLKADDERVRGKLLRDPHERAARGRRTGPLTQEEFAHVEAVMRIVNTQHPGAAAAAPTSAPAAGA